MGKEEKIYQAWSTFLVVITKCLSVAKSEISTAGALRGPALERDCVRLAEYIEDVESGLEEIKAGNLDRAQDYFNSLDALFSRRIERLYGISESQYTELQSAFNLADEISKNPNKSGIKGQKRLKTSPVTKFSPIKLQKYNKTKLIETLKKAHQFYVEQIQKELYVEFEKKPDFMTNAAFENYKEILEQRLLKAQDSLKNISVLQPVDFERLQSTGLTAIIAVQFSNIRLEPCVFFLVPETTISAEALQRFDFPLVLSWNTYLNSKVGDKVKLVSSGHGETFEYFAEITDIQ